MSIAAMGRDSLARALFASVAIHALAFHTLGGWPRPHAEAEPPPLQVRLMRPPPAEPAPAPLPPRPLAVKREVPARPAAPRPRPVAPPAPSVPAIVPAASEAPPSAPPAAPPLETARAATAAPLAAPPEAAPDTGQPAAPQSDRSTLRTRFGRGIEQAIDATKSYPRVARERGWQGTVRVRLRFLAGGGLGRIEVVDSSGFPLLDEHALRMARAAELPAVPDPLAAEAFELDVPIRFHLRS